MIRFRILSQTLKESPLPQRIIKQEQQQVSETPLCPVYVVPRLRVPRREFKTSKYAGLFLDKITLTTRRPKIPLGQCVSVELLGDPKR